jgi:hypothetical protein
MKSVRCKNLHLAGIDVLLPALVCIDGRQTGRRHTSVIIGFAELYADNVVGSLVGQWLEHLLHRSFVEHARGDEGDLAAAAFYDKLAYSFAGGVPFVSALIVTRDKSLEATLGVSRGTLALPTSGRTRDAVSNEERALTSLVHGDEFAKWNFSGRVRAYLGTGAVQVSFEDLPGGIELISTDKSATRLLADAHEVDAWYGFGVPVRNPADAVVKLRNQIAAIRRPGVEPRAAHAAHA